MLRTSTNSELELRKLSAKCKMVGTRNPNPQHNLKLM